jgi:tetratricopeptide (TPR) repeat protein
MDSQGPTEKNKASRLKIYRLLAIISLVLMALLWSLDDFFVYLFLGSAIYFFFLVYWNRPTQSSQEAHQGFSQGAYSEFEKTFSKKTKGRTASPEEQRKKAAIIISMVMFAVFMLLVSVIVIFSADGDEEDESLMYQKASDFNNSGDYDSSKFYYRKVIAVNPDRTDALLEYGNVLLSEKAYDSALNYYEQAFAVNDTYWSAYYNHALTKYYQQNYDESRNEALDLYERDPDYYDAAVLVGDNYYAQQSLDSAITWYEDGYDHGVRSAWLSHVMAYIYDTKSDTEKAVMLYKEAVQYDSSKTDACARLGELLPGSDGDVYRQLANTQR